MVEMVKVEMVKVVKVGMVEMVKVAVRTWQLREEIRF
jgi:hypothetical protein